MSTLDIQDVVDVIPGLMDDSVMASRKKPSGKGGKGGKGDKGGKGGKDRKEKLGTNKNDVIIGDASNNTVEGLNGKDQLQGGDGDDILNGGNGNDLLTGGNGNDVLTGGNGKDTLVGGVGNDTLTGGRGKDVFVMDNSLNGVDTITDYNINDQIDLKSIFATPAFAGTDTLTRFQQFVQLVQVGADTEIRVDADGSGLGTTFTTLAVVQNVAVTSLSSTNVVIA